MHGYDAVTAPELYDLLTGRLGDIEEMAAAVRTWMAAHPDRVAEDD